MRVACVPSRQAHRKKLGSLVGPISFKARQLGWPKILSKFGSLVGPNSFENYVVSWVGRLRGPPTQKYDMYGI